jgi:hypothetical protein
MRTLNETARWIGLIGIIDVLHLSEQMLFGLGELATLKQILAPYYSWFRQPDYGTLVLAMIASAMLFSLVFAAMAGWRGARSRRRICRRHCDLGNAPLVQNLLRRALHSGNRNCDSLRRGGRYAVPRSVSGEAESC